MDVVYFFCESAVVSDGKARRQVRAPFFEYDWRLFNMFVALGWVWDKWRQEFYFQGNTNAEQCCRNFPEAVCVWVDENSPARVRTFGFWERPWESDASHELKSIMPGLPHPPEKFSDHWQAKLEAELRSRKYSHCTLRAYIYYNRFFCRVLQKSPEDVCPEDITQFLAVIEKEREYSASSLNLAISAVKFFYKYVFKSESISEQHRPKHDKKLPQVLAKSEISAILKMEINPKHRLLLMLVYSSGLRVSEVVTLKKEHIDLSRKLIYVRLGKGRKDRCTVLSEKAARFIVEYCELYNIQTWLFPGQPATHHLSIRSAQYIFDKAVRRARIPKEISIHSLRHTFATHLLESGTDIRYIQALLGHASLHTTERYTHIARRSILSIQSPLDSIV